ncbi:uncharacterized protein LOC144578329 [Callithrix jacchus]
MRSAVHTPGTAGAGPRSPPRAGGAHAATPCGGCCRPLSSFGADHHAEQEAAAAGPVTGGSVTGSQVFTWVLSVKPGWPSQQTKLLSHLLTDILEEGVNATLPPREQASSF